MVLSESDNFIYIRVPKNASTSLATFFIQNYCKASDKWSKVGDAGIPTRNIPDRVIDKHRVQYRFIHLTLNEIIDEGLITASEALKREVIGVIRNPFERQLSLYFFLNRNKRNECSPEMFRKLMQKGYYEADGSNHILQTDYLKIGDTNVGTYWKYDALDDHIRSFIDRHGEPQHPIKTFKSNFKPKNENLVSDYYDAATRRAVEAYFAKDFEEYENR